VRFAAWLPVAIGTTLGMIAANLPVVFLGGHLLRVAPLKTIRWGAAFLSGALGLAALLE
jgi:putative Ca2+/H+ antiporter (TMEM165/GDT1 family)